MTGFSEVIAGVTMQRLSTGSGEVQFNTVWRRLDGVLWMSEGQAREIYDFILTTKPKRVLELGFAYGKSSAVIAAALDEVGDGVCDSVDLLAVKDIFANPTIEDLLRDLSLAARVHVHREEHSYVWFLKKRLDDQLRGRSIAPLYDFCYIDGAHNFTIDTCAFLLVDRLLEPGGTVLFDDLDYSYAEMNAGEDKPNEPPPFTVDDYDPRARVIRTRMSDDELRAYPVKAIFDLLVSTHPDYEHLRISQNGTWGWAQKRRAAPTGARGPLNRLARRMPPSW